MVKRKVKYKKRSGKKNLTRDIMPATTSNTNPDDIEIGDEIGPVERLKKNKEDH